MKNYQDGNLRMMVFSAMAYSDRCCRQSVTVSFDIVIKVPKTCTKKLLLKKFLIIFSINGRVFVLRFALRTLCHCSKIHAPHLF